MQLPKTELNKFKRHCLKNYPNEACAVAIETDSKLKVINCNNTHDDPLNHFRIDGKTISDYLINGSLKAVLHSHTHTSNKIGDLRTPSAHDIQGHIDTSVPWGIVATDGITVSDPIWLDDNEIQPLLGRQFVHGVYDCLAILRDYYKIHRGITIKNYARDPDWWTLGQSLCTDEVIADNGFTPIKYTDLQEGDIVLMQIASPVPQHWAVVTGNNTIIHQLPHRLSCEDSLSKWKKFVIGCFRYNK